MIVELTECFKEEKKQKEKNTKDIDLVMSQLQSVDAGEKLGQNNNGVTPTTANTVATTSATVEVTSEPSVVHSGAAGATAPPTG